MFCSTYAIMEYTSGNNEISQAFILGLVVFELFNILRITHKDFKNGCFFFS